MVHPAPLLELGRQALDRALHAKRLAATDAAEWLFLLEHARSGSFRPEIELGSQGDYILRTSGLAHPALHAGILGEPQHRSLGVVTERAGRTGRHTGEAERAAADIDVDGTEGRLLGKLHPVDWRRRCAVQLAQRDPHHAAFSPHRQEAWRARDGS